MKAIVGDPRKNELGEGVKKMFTRKDYELWWTSLPGLGWLFVCLSVCGKPRALHPLAFCRYSFTMTS